MFTGIITAIGDVRAVTPARGCSRHAPDHRRAGRLPRGPRRHRAGRVHRLLRLLPDRDRARARLVRGRRLGRDARPHRWADGRRHGASTWNAPAHGRRAGRPSSSPATWTASGDIAAATPENGSLRLTSRCPPPCTASSRAKGSVAVDGVSLTVNDVAAARTADPGISASTSSRTRRSTPRSACAHQAMRCRSKSTRWPATSPAWPKPHERAHHRAPFEQPGRPHPRPPARSGQPHRRADRRGPGRPHVHPGR